MRRLLPLLILALVGCNERRGERDADRIGTDDTGSPQIPPPVACPVGNLKVSQQMIDADLALLDAWNAMRTTDGICSDGSEVAATNALAADESLMWAARCWAFDVSKNGQPPASDQFSDGSTIAEAAKDQGFVGIVNGWGLQGGLDSPEQALENWLAGDPDACARLWADGSKGAMAISQAGDLLVVARVSAL